jgi:hypothetical protein
MGSGLIWAGIGKGISDAGTAYGGAMLKQVEIENQDRRDELREQRATLRQESLERLKEAMVEERSQKDAARAIKIDERALDIGQQRASKAFEPLAASSAQAGTEGDIELPKETLERFSKENPTIGKQYRDMGLVNSSMPLTRNEGRMQSADDQIQAARELGASSTQLKSYQDLKKTTLDEIREENKETGRKADRDATNSRLDQQARRDEWRYENDGRANDARDKSAAAAMKRADASQRQADAAWARANRPPAEKGAAQERMTTMVNSANQTIEKLNNTSKGTTEESKKNWQRQMDDAVRLRDNATANLNRLFDEEKPAGKGAGASTKPPAANSPATSGKPIPEPKTPQEAKSLKPGTLYKAPDGTIRVKS